MASKMISTTKNSVQYTDCTTPKMVLDNETFLDGLNAVLISRFTVDALVKIASAEKTITSAEKWLAEHSELEDADEIAEHIKMKDRATENLANAKALKTALTAEAVNYADISINPEYSEITTLFSLMFSTTGEINTETGKAGKLVLSGINNLYSKMCTYADMYQNVETWDEKRGEKFRELKDLVNAIGSRLNGNGTALRSGFKYGCSTKDCNQLVAVCTKHATPDKTGKIKSVRANKYGFQKVVIATIFRINVDVLTTSDEVEV